MAVDLGLATSPTLPPVAKRSLTREVEAIWCREGVTVRWSSPQGALSRTTSIQVVVVSGAVGEEPEDEHDWPVGELLTTQSGRSIALVSISAAQRVIVAARRSEGPSTLADHRLGVVLGRAVSHELGHYLLGRSHADRGLMRAHISATDFADLRAGSFGLDRSSGARIRELPSH